MTDAFKSMVAHAMAVMVLITDQHDPKPGDHGTVTCPRCGGTVHWRTAAPNNHIRAVCETENCVRFMS